MTNWAADHFLLQRAKMRHPTPELVGVRRGLSVAEFTLSAVAAKAGRRPPLELDFPYRFESGYASTDAPVVFAGQGSHELRVARSRWASDFLVGVHGDYDSCRRKFGISLMDDRSLQRELPGLRSKGIHCECPIGYACHIDVLCVAVEAYAEGESSKLRGSVQRIFLADWVSLPRAVVQFWSQASFEHAFKAFLPDEARLLRVQFLQDIVNPPVFTDCVAWVDSHASGPSREMPPMWTGGPSKRLTRLTEGRQDGAFSSNSAAQQVVGFGKSKAEHLQAAITSVKSLGFPMGRF